ncbi:hypothetical protein GUITHDRAFT_113657 [Guillardia theta CCMP2712]|uniref:Integrator complex subunit 7 n=1 Tax=Guillardia theta (strain CCMP2712) TaxID=905079 RepID=L1IVA1_GUITC|nr:hypothetical protein GUITHDRAFT_113657 [Guillardia theta CCMP2712]EKX40178.1 hypothetical protein GUITHDRAFT_113657 [Guillardia theta CCMP2712]|eukprot:XP_005827158.1 hypothetical protein GUITHDRAFT_113657 [Guillardia theta CCMP2712]
MVLPNTVTTEREQQSAIIELDKLLNSKTSTPAVSFVNILSSYPTTSVCNSIFLKLGDIFKSGDNTIRFCVLKVFEKCRKLLVRVFNAERLVKRVHHVFENEIDPAARSLAIRMFACMAILLVDDKRIHSDVRNAIRSPNESEVSACIFCIKELCRVSISFASDTLSLIREIVLALETPLMQRLQLISSLEYMCGDPVTALDSWVLLTDVLDRYPMLPIVLVSLRTLSQLSIKSSIRHEQLIKLMLEYMKTDERSEVQSMAAHCLSTLVSSAAFVFDCPHDDIVAVARTSKCIEVQESCIRMMVVLVEQESCDSSEDLYSFQSKVLTCGSTMLQETGSLNKEDITLMHTLLEIFPTNSASSKRSAESLAAQMTLCSRVVGSFCEAINTTWEKGDPHRALEASCQSLSLCASQFPHLMNDLIRKLFECPRGSENPVLFLSLVKSIMFLGMSNLKSQVETIQMIKSKCLSALRENPWNGYRLLRSAFVMGYLKLALPLIDELKTKVESVRMRAWMSSLYFLAEAEEIRTSENYSMTVEKLQEAAQQMYVVGPSSKTFTFQKRYLKALITSNDALSRLRLAVWDWLDFRPLDPSQKVQHSDTEELHECKMISEAIRSLEVAKDKILELRRCRFGTDAQSEMCLEQHAICQAFIARVASVMFLNEDKENLIYGWDSIVESIITREKQTVLAMLPAQTCKALMKWLTDLFAESGRETMEGNDSERGELSDLHRVQAFLHVMGALNKLPLLVPPSFLDTSNPVYVDIKSLPSPKSAMEPIETQLGIGCVLKIEATIVNLHTRQSWSSQITYIVLSVVINYDALDPKGTTAKFPQSMQFKLRCKGGSVSTSCLLPVSQALGSYSVSISADILDNRGNCWDGGPATSLRVRTVQTLGAVKSSGTAMTQASA